MKTIVAAFVSIAFLAPVAMACPHEEGTAKKDEKAETKQAEAKPAPKAPTRAPATVKAAPKATPKATTGSKSETGKVSQR